jgi:hypothetical protein
MSITKLKLYKFHSTQSFTKSYDSKLRVQKYSTEVTQSPKHNEFDPQSFMQLQPAKRQFYIFSDISCNSSSSQAVLGTLVAKSNELEKVFHVKPSSCILLVDILVRLQNKTYKPE